MSLLKGTRGYLAGNLENVSGDESSNWRGWFKRSVAEMGIKCLDPTKTVFKNFPVEHEGFQREVKEMRENHEFDELNRKMLDVRRRDLAMVDKCEFVVANIDPSKPTWGTTEELAMAIRMNKPIYLVIKGGLKNIPLWVAGMVKPDSWYASLETVVMDLWRINSGRKEICTTRWRILEDDLLL